MAERQISRRDTFAPRWAPFFTTKATGNGTVAAAARANAATPRGIVKRVLAWFAAASVVGFVASLIAIPWILVRLPADYFDTRVPRHWMKDRHPILRALGLIIKNVVGLVFLLAGGAMLVLPGQGILTILIGVSLIDFPGKQRIEAGLVSYRLVRQGINAIRAKFGRPPLVVAPEL